MRLGNKRLAQRLKRNLHRVRGKINTEIMKNRAVDGVTIDSSNQTVKRLK